MSVLGFYCHKLQLASKVRKRFCLSIIALVAQIFFNTAISQNTNLAWVKQMGSAGDDISWSVAVDNSGNSYTTGLFSGTADFDPGPSVFNLTSFGDYDIFIVKLDANGNFMWAKQMGGAGTDHARSITLDANGNIYTIGRFFSTADFDPGAGVYNLTSVGQSDIFISKLDYDGNFIWAKQMGGTDYDTGWSIAVDAASNVYTTGEFLSSTVDFDPGPGISNLVTFGNQDVYISKLDAAGNFVWVKQIGGTSIDEVRSIKTDNVGNVYISGDFYGTVTDFDPGPSIYNLSCLGWYDGYLLKLDANGNFVWVKQIGGSDADQVLSLTVDNSGNVFSIGYFSGTVDFDPGPGTFILNASGSNGIFVLKLDALGNFVWAKQMSGTTHDPQINLGSSIAVDPGGYIYTLGSFLNTVDFDPGPGTSNLTSVGMADIFISVLDGAGNFIVVKQIGSAVNENAIKIIATPNNEIYMTGFFGATADFDACSGIYNLSSAGYLDFFVEKFDQPKVSISASSTTVCSGSAVTFTAAAINTGIAPVYQWQVNGVNVGTGSTTYTSSVLNNNDQVRVILTSNATCTPPGKDTSNAITVTVNSVAAPAVTIVTTATTICTGSVVTFTASPVNGGPSPAYQWLVNGINAGTNAPSFTTSTLANNDVVKVVITNSSTCAAINSATSNSITMQVNTGVVPAVSIAVSANNICPGTSVNFTALPLNPGTTASYQWKLNGNNIGSNSLAYISNSFVNGDKIFCVMNTISSCSSTAYFNSDTVTMIVDPIPAIIFNPGSVITSLGNAVQLNAVINGSYNNYFWTPATGLNSPLVLNPVANPLISTVYTLHVSTTNNCITEKELSVTVSKGIYIPNSFTPNGDRLNDIFRIPAGIVFDLENFSIYNRYGDEIFRTSDINKGWDGTYMGSRSPSGGYIYIIKGRDAKGDILLKGSILLIR